MKEENLNKLYKQKHTLQEELFKISKQIIIEENYQRLSELSKIEKSPLPLLPFGFICYSIHSLKVEEKTIERIRRFVGSNKSERWTYYSEGDYELCDSYSSGNISWADGIFPSLEIAEKELKIKLEKKEQEEERKRQSKIEQAKKLLAECELEK